jgi:hypothetical protein
MTSAPTVSLDLNFSLAIDRHKVHVGLGHQLLIHEMIPECVGDFEGSDDADYITPETWKSWYILSLG